MRIHSAVGRLLWIIAWMAVMIGLANGCGGAANDVEEVTEPQVCGTDFRVPNYAPSVSRYHWGDFPVRIYVDDTTSSYTSEEKARFLARWQSWSDALDSQVNYELTTDKESAEIEVYLVTRAEVLKVTGNNTALGTTRIDRIGNRLTHTRIYISMTDNRDVLSTMAHEIGHGLGISGHSPYKTDLMYAVQQSRGPIAPTERDENTVRTAYCGIFPQTNNQSNSRTRGTVQSETIICTDGEHQP